MKILKLIYIPFAILWLIFSSIRNLLFDLGLKKSIRFDRVFIINVGNLAVGGSGKSPLVEYLVRLLMNKYKIAILSRGYKRKTKGFVLANKQTTFEEIGDEPMQFYSKFPDLNVAVCEKRVQGVTELLKKVPSLQIVILDDAFQHRNIKPDFNILVSEHNNPFTEDHLLPFGRLRESRYEAKRADLVVISKSPNQINTTLNEEIRKYCNAPIWYSKINYLSMYDLFTNEEVTDFPKKVLLVTGIVNTKPLINYLKNKVQIEKHYEFNDHHNYTTEEIQIIINHKIPIITTEKDAVKIITYKNLCEKSKVLIIPIGNEFIGGNEKFNSIIVEAISNKKTINS